MVAFKPVDKDYTANATSKMLVKTEPAVSIKTITKTIKPIYETPKVPIEPAIPQTDIPKVPLAPGIPIPALPVDDGSDGSDDCALPSIDDTEDDDSSLPSLDLRPDIHIEPRIPVLRMADLTVLSIEPDRKKVALGETVNFKFGIKNVGTKPAKFTYAFYPDYANRTLLPFRLPAGSVSKIKPMISDTVALDAGETFVGTISFTYPALSLLHLPGSILPTSVRPTIVADYGDNVPEWNEDNNVASTTVLLYKPGTEVRRPDLTAEVTSAGTEFEVGETVDFDVVIQNIGTQELLTADFDIDFGDGSDVEHYNHFFEIGQSWASTMGHKFAEPGAYVVSVVADPSNAAIESNERNNRDLVRVTVVESPVVSFQCSDGIDNDQDGLVDLDDPGCGSAEDDDEF
ncbi:hypothetical protein JW898_02360, partial [Candidatus Woesearchaeota archaeon]|nr:hypothetical protein [Candidatus Woesearchaeota archaeon]